MSEEPRIITIIPYSHYYGVGGVHLSYPRYKAEVFNLRGDGVGLYLGDLALHQGLGFRVEGLGLKV